MSFAQPRVLVPLILLLAGAQAANPKEMLVVTSGHASGVYGIGEEISWHIEWRDDSRPQSARYKLKRGGLTDAGEGSVTFENGVATVKSKLEAPGAMLLEVSGADSDGEKFRVLGGAIAAPEKIKLSSPRPADFDAFWEAKLAELAEVPMNPQIKPGQWGTEGVDYFYVTLDNIRGSKIHGQLARPTKGEKFPAMLVVQWAGVYGLHPSWVNDRAAEGWLVLNIMPHDIPFDQNEDFYTQQQSGPLKNYWEIGNDDRDKSYFLRMYLSCHRAAEYLTTRPDWDGRVLVVTGASQGGLQALIAAGLNPKITAAASLVPAGCDMLGADVGRAPGWPMWYWKTEGKDTAKVREASRYYDVANFAPRIKCPVLVGVGLLDELCPPEGVIAAANQISSPKEIIIMPDGEHGNARNGHERFAQRCWEAWMPALRAGKPAPVN